MTSVATLVAGPTGIQFSGQNQDLGITDNGNCGVSAVGSSVGLDCTATLAVSGATTTIVTATTIASSVLNAGLFSASSAPGASQTSSSSGGSQTSSSGGSQTSAPRGSQTSAASSQSSGPSSTTTSSASDPSHTGNGAAGSSISTVAAWLGGAGLMILL